MATVKDERKPEAERTTDEAVKVPLFGARAFARKQLVELAELRAQLERSGALTNLELERERDRLREEIADARNAAARESELRDEQARQAQRALDEQLARKRDELARLEAGVVATEELQILQEVGLYEYRHPLTDAVAYRAELERLRTAIKSMAKKDGGAVLADSGWTVNGSVAKGRTMIRDYSKLMLRAYNAEADNLVRGLKPYKLQASIDRLDKVAETIARLGRTMSIAISPPYHRARIQELELTADYVEQLAQEKEREREEKAQLREERKAQLELDRERERLDKERSHYVNALRALRANGDAEGAADLEAKLAEIERSIEDVEHRVANVRAGYVYVISNVGAFGDSVVKVGMTRRLEPMDRVRELGDASVPFRFDVHALFFSEDAVGIESAVHRALADRRLNRVNLRREFFRATPGEVRSLLLELTGNLLQFEEAPEALEYRQSENLVGTSGAFGSQAAA